jgi:O-antigen/teichoic acid export membrane protein
VTDAVISAPARPAGLRLNPVIVNTLTLIAGQMLVQASTALIGILIARYLGKESYGQYVLAFAFSGTVGLLFSMGADYIVIREIARDPSRYRALFSAALWIRIVTLPLISGGLALLAALLGYEVEQRGYIFLAALVLGLTTLGDLPRSVFQARQRMTLDTLTRGLDKVCALVLVVTGVMMLGNASISAILMLLIVGSLLGTGAAVITLTRIAGAPHLQHPREAVGLMRRSLPLIASMILMIVFEQLAMILLSLSHSYYDIGSYGAALSLVSPFGLLALALQASLLPRLAVSTQRGIDPRAHARAIALNLAITLPMCAALYLAAPLLVSALYGDEFAPVIETLRALILLLPVLYVSIYGNTLLIAAGKTRHLLGIVLFNLALTLVFGAIIIPAGGSMGAVIVRVLAPAIGTIIMMVLIPRWLRAAPHSEEAV